MLSLASTGEADPVAPDHTGSPLLNALWTLLHTPVVSIQAGDGPNGLPLAVQLIGFRYGDGALLSAADAVARVVDPWYGKVRLPG